MTLNSVVVVMFPAMLALYVPACPTPVVRPTAPSDPAPLIDLWEEPRDLPTRALFDGPWGLENAPDPGDTYSFVRAKQRGTTQVWSSEIQRPRMARKATCSRRPR